MSLYNISITYVFNFVLTSKEIMEKGIQFNPANGKSSPLGWSSSPFFICPDEAVDVFPFLDHNHRSCVLRVFLQKPFKLPMPYSLYGVEHA